MTDPPEDTEVAKNRRTTDRVARTKPDAAETWSTGHRNPGLAFAPDGRLWATEMGPRGGDEFNLILPGRNYGWPNVSNGRNYNGVDIPDHRPGDGYEAPKVYWNPSISPARTDHLHGRPFPSVEGRRLFGALSGQALVHVRIRGDQASKAEQWEMGQRIRDVQQGPRGELYVLEDGRKGGPVRLLRLTPAASAPRS